MMNGICGGILDAVALGTAPICTPHRRRGGSDPAPAVPGRQGLRLPLPQAPVASARRLAMLTIPAMTLADLIDLEVQLARDRESDRAELVARDKKLLAADPARPRSPQAVLARWIEALRAAEPGQLHPGRAVVGALAGLRATLVLLGLVLG